MLLNRAWHIVGGIVPLLCILTAACQPQPPSKVTRTDSPAVNSTLFQAAEYDSTAAVWLLWSNYPHRQGYSNESVTCQIIESVLPYAPVRLVVPDAATAEHARSLLPATAIELRRIEFVQLPYREFWARDMGPTFVTNGKGHRAMVDFSFNAWGYAPATDSVVALDERLDEGLASRLGLKTITTPLVTEGGDHETDGHGTFILTESVEMSRNPQLSRVQIEAEFSRTLGAKVFIWIPEGLRDDDHTFRGPVEVEHGVKAYPVLTTNGHADEYVRFVNDSTVLLAMADSAALAHSPLERANAARLDAAYQRLSAATTATGRRLRIIRMPLPYPIIDWMAPGDAVYDQISVMEYTNGHRFPKGKRVRTIAAASYLNFLIVNGLVLMPKYWKPGMSEQIKARDEAAVAVMQSVFPDKKIVAIDVLAVNWGGGGIHCITRNEPF
jgi:agmatine deiminase